MCICVWIITCQLAGMLVIFSASLPNDSQNQLVEEIHFPRNFNWEVSWDRERLEAFTLPSCVDEIFRSSTCNYHQCLLGALPAQCKNVRNTWEEIQLWELCDECFCECSVSWVLWQSMYYVRSTGRESGSGFETIARESWKCAFSKEASAVVLYSNVWLTTMTLSWIHADVSLWLTAFFRNRWTSNIHQIVNHCTWCSQTSRAPAARTNTLHLRG